MNPELEADYSDFLRFPEVPPPFVAGCAQSGPGMVFPGLVYLMFPIERLKALARDAIRAGRWRTGAGDAGRFTVALIRLKDILR
jgi:hypothetical protein